MAAIGNIRRFNGPRKLVSYFGLNPRCAVGPITVASVKSAAVMRAPCWSMRLGRRPTRPVRCMPFLCASVPGAAIKSPRWPWLASSLCSAGIYCRRVRIINGHVRRWSPTKPARCSFQPESRNASRRGPAYAYNIKELRDREMLIAAQAERSYERFVAEWKSRRLKIDARAPQLGKT